MKKAKTILVSLALAVSVAAVALTTWANKPTDPFFEANLEALASIEKPMDPDYLIYKWFVEEKHNGEAIVCTLGGQEQCK